MPASANGRTTRPIRRQIRHHWGLLAVISVAAAACDDSSRSPAYSGTSVDTRGDMATPSCQAGVAGCPCDGEGDQYVCGVLERRDGDYVTCSEGLSTCTNGTWGACLGTQRVVRSTQSIKLGKSRGLGILATAAGCDQPCNPYCSTVTADTTTDVGADAGGVGPSPEGGIALVGGTGVPAGPSCTGLQCNVSACNGDATVTKLTGRVFDPAGKVPLYNAYVYVPVDPDLSKLPAFTDTWTSGVSCDRCSDTSVRAVALAQTGVDGAFTLEGVPSGANIPLVVQMGRWRRSIVLSTITACQSNVVTNNCTATDKSLCAARLPRSRFDGYNPTGGGYTYVSATGANGKADIPIIAMVSGSADPFECMLLKAGLDPSEFGSYDTHPERRIHYYHSPDSPGSKLSSTYGNQINGGVLWNSATNLAKYDLVILACEGKALDKLQGASPPASGVNPYKNIIDYTTKGGKVFTTHYGYVWLQYPYVKSGYSDWRYAASWTHQTGTTATQDPLTAAIVTSFPKGSSFATWLLNVGATATANQLSLHEGRQDLTTIGSSAQSWMTATNSKVTSNGAFVPHFTFNTPYGAAAADQCGRLVFSDFHVSANALVNTSSNTCYTAADCGFTATCSGTAPTLGSCSEPCGTTTDCSPGYTCTGTTTAGACAPRTCTTTCSAGGTCSSGLCRCTDSGQCGSDTCTLAPGTCGAATCTQDANCGESERCVGATAGTCASDTCSSNSQCASGYCVSGHCACTSRTQCSSNSCSATAAACASDTCTSDDAACGSSETCTLGTSGVCVPDSCSKKQDCSTNGCWGGACYCSKSSQCGTGRSCNWGSCSSKTCTSDSQCQGWEHCRFAGTCDPKACDSSNPCAAGTCEADGKCHCTSNAQCASNSCTKYKGSCTGTAASCLGDSSCGSVEYCSGVTTGACGARSCSTSNPCPAGSCVSGVCKCTSASDCASNSCTGLGSCGAQVCYASTDCGVTEQCSGATVGNCTKACTVNLDCPNGEKCTSGKCTGCTSSSQCQTQKYQGSCTGASGGTLGSCNLNSSSLFPQACHQGDLTPQEKALEFMFLDLTACVTPDAYAPSPPASLFAPATFSPADYVASCEQGFKPVWRELKWQASIPSSGSITFAAQSGPAASALLPATPVTVVTATTSTVSGATDVAYIDTGTTGSGAFNLATPRVFSDNVLRLSITLTPTTDQLTSPRLLNWAVSYDCVASE